MRGAARAARAGHIYHKELLRVLARAPYMQRRGTEACRVTIVEDIADEYAKQLRAPPRRICERHRCTCIGAISVFASLCVARWFITTRCFLIDWSADLGSPPLTEVPVAHTQAQLDMRIRNHQPALFLAALREWPAVRNWSPDYFARLEGMRDRWVEIYFWGHSGADWQRTSILGMTLAEYAKLLTAYGQRRSRLGPQRAGPAPYLQEDETLFEEFRSVLLLDVAGFPFRPSVSPPAGWRPFTPVGDAGERYETAFWIGPAGARTGIHYDAVDALLHQLHGAKRIQLWPPSARRSLYPSSKYNHGAELSLVDAAAPNLTEHPAFAEAQSLSVLLSAGSALFLPAGWWHSVTSLDTTVSLALRSTSTCQRVAALSDDILLLLHRLGLYKKGNCVCHSGRGDSATIQRLGHRAHGGGDRGVRVEDGGGDDSDDGDDGIAGLDASMRASVQALLREAGVTLEVVE